jgi:hypothetical protein
MTSYQRGNNRKSSENLALINEFEAKRQRRMTQGLSVYGEFSAATDTRCLSQEGIEEILDAGNYLELLEIKHPSLRSAIQKNRAKLILAYGEWKKLRAAEEELTFRREGDLSE